MRAESGAEREGKMLWGTGRSETLKDFSELSALVFMRCVCVEVCVCVAASRAGTSVLDVLFP